MDATERAAIEQRLGRFATMSAEDLDLWFQEREAARAAAAAARRDRCNVHAYIWQSEACIRCGALPDEDEDF